jgi:uncharacterized Zn-binding protein involved in type VI secretion
LPASAAAQDNLLNARLELEVGGDATVGLGDHCHPGSEPQDDTIECGDSMFIVGGGVAAILRPVAHLGLGVAAAAGSSLFKSAESSPSQYRLALEARGYLDRTAAGFYGMTQLGVTWLDPKMNQSDIAPTVAIGLGHVWSQTGAGFGVGLGLTGSLAFFGKYKTSSLPGYGTLGFIGLSLRLTYGLPL